MKKTRIIHFATLIFLLTAARFFVLFLIEPVDYSIFFNHILENKSAGNDDRIDMVFVGGSRGLRTFDPDIFENELGFNCVFNASSGLQPIESSYYMLTEMINRYHPKYAIVALSWDELFDNNSTLAKVIVYDRLTGLNKLKYLWNAFTPNEYLNTISLCYRFRDNFNRDFISGNIKEKIDLSKNNYFERISYPDLYKDNGFIYSYQSGDIPNYGNIVFNPDAIDTEKAAYLEKITELCQQEEVDLFLVSAPTTIMTLYRVENYQMAVDYYLNFAEKHGINYVNLNYLKGREEWLPDNLMFDFNHVNGEGAEIVSEKYAKYLKVYLSGEEAPDIFYKNLKELQAEVHRIFAVGADIYIGDLQASVKISSRQSDGITPLYRVQFSQDDEEYTPLTDWTSETEFIFDLSAYRGMAYFLIEAKSTTGEPGSTIKYSKEI